jgi:hypothetical protein
MTDATKGNLPEFLHLQNLYIIKINPKGENIVHNTWIKGNPTMFEQLMWKAIVRFDRADDNS